MKKWEEEIISTLLAYSVQRNIMKITSEKHTNKLKANEKTVISSQALNNNNNKIIPTVD